MLENEETDDIEQVNTNTITNNQSLNDLLTQSHPCQDCNAKWSLEKLFNSGLEVPTFAHKWTNN